MQPKYQLGDALHIVEPVRFAEQVTIEIDGHKLDADFTRGDSGQAQLVINGLTHDVWVAQDDDTIFVHAFGRAWQLQAVNEFAEALGDEEAGGTERAPMPGVVLEVQVSVGDVVEEDQALMMIESMKLQTQIRASVAGTVAQIDYEAGQSFDKGAALVVITPAVEGEA